MDYDIRATLSQESSESLAVLSSPHANIPFHPGHLAVGGMAAECVIEFREGHVTIQHRQRYNTHYWVTAHHKRSVWKLIDVNLMDHAFSIIAKQTVCKWAFSAVRPCQAGLSGNGGLRSVRYWTLSAAKLPITFRLGLVTRCLTPKALFVTSLTIGHKRRGKQTIDARTSSRPRSAGAAGRAKARDRTS
jgi:hypothetical protein